MHLHERNFFFSRNVFCWRHNKFFRFLGFFLSTSLLLLFGIVWISKRIVVICSICIRKRIVVLVYIHLDTREDRTILCHLFHETRKVQGARNMPRGDHWRSLSPELTLLQSVQSSKLSHKVGCPIWIRSQILIDNTVGFTQVHQFQAKLHEKSSVWSHGPVIKHGRQTANKHARNILTQDQGLKCASQRRQKEMTTRSMQHTISGILRNQICEDSRQMNCL